MWLWRKENPCTIGGIVNWYKHKGKYKVSSKNYIYKMPDDPVTPLLGIYLKEKKNIVSKIYLHFHFQSSNIFNSQEIKTNKQKSQLLPIFDWLFVFLVLSCVSCLYILGINSLSVVSFATIFSHSEDCPFTLLIVSFVV